GDPSAPVSPGWAAARTARIGGCSAPRGAISRPGHRGPRRCHDDLVLSRHAGAARRSVGCARPGRTQGGMAFGPSRPRCGRCRRGHAEPTAYAGRGGVQDQIRIIGGGL
ncbi:MAG: hypothetical protein AVDCRST_MAG49-3778, partial [uncultured Thermomicrobiales bacterium]